MESYAFLFIFASICAIFDSRLSFAFDVEPSITVLAQKLSNSSWYLFEDLSGLRTNATVDRIQARIFRKVGSLHETFKQLERPLLSISFEDAGDIIAEITNSKNNDISKLLDHMVDVDYYFGQLVEDSLGSQNVPAEGNWLNLSRDIISHKSTSVKSLVRKIHDVVTPRTKYNSGLFKWLAVNKDIHDQLVRTMHQSPQQLLYNLFNKIALTQIKGYVSIQFSYTILGMYNQGIFSKESQTAKKNFQRRTKAMVKEVKRALAIVPREYWRFDPEEYKAGENYLEITRLLQGYVVNENVLNNGGRCYGKCEMFKKTHIASCQNNVYCRMQRPCGGNVYDCRDLKNIDMNVCPASEGSTRKYDYIEYEDHSVLGKKSTCSRSTAALKGWIGWCVYCMCSCEDEGRFSDRFVSLKRAISNTKANKVVTGIKFVKRDRIIHLQVQQGELLPYGLVNVTTLEWVPVNSFKITDRYIHDRTEYFKLGRDRNGIDLHVKEVEGGNEGYPKRVITGLRFSLLKTHENIHLNLEIRETAFDFDTGKLFLNSNQWTKNTRTQFSPDKRTQISIDNVDMPTRSTTENTVQSHGVQYVEFTQTSLEKDAAQTTVPFIDAQEVVPSAPTPLIGAGVYYKAAEGYGGFLGLKIVTYDFTEHL